MIFSYLTQGYALQAHPGLQSTTPFGCVLQAFSDAILAVENGVRPDIRTFGEFAMYRGRSDPNVRMSRQTPFALI